jgi:hypothetical protein
LRLIVNADVGGRRLIGWNLQFSSNALISKKAVIVNSCLTTCQDERSLKNT